MDPLEDRNMYTNSGAGREPLQDGSSDEELSSLGFRVLLWLFRFVWYCIVKPVFNLVWSIISGILLIFQAVFWFALVVGGILYFANDSFHAYANQNYLMRKAEFKLAFSEPLPEDWARKEYMSIAAEEVDNLMIREREKFYSSLPLARRDYHPAVQIKALIDREPQKLEKTVAYKGDRKYEVYCHFGENLGIYKVGNAGRHHNFGQLYHDFRVWVEAVPPKARNHFSYGKYTWKVLQVKDVGYEPSNGFDKAVRLYKNYVFTGDK